MRTPRTDGERGSVLILAALAATAVMGFAAVSVDAGRLYIRRQRLVDVCDAAALAGAQDLPENPGAAEAAARQFLARNGVDPALAGVSISDGGSTIRVSFTGEVDTPFGGVLGSGSASVGAGSAIQVGNTGNLHGAQPFGIETETFEYGETYRIKLNGGSSGQFCGNFHALALGGGGGCHYRQMIIDGYSGLVEVGDEILTEPGNMSGPTKQGLQARFDADPCATFETVSSDSSRILKVPMVTPFVDCYGRSQVTVLGFAAFFLEERCTGGEVRGRFMRLLTEGEFATGGVDYGLRTFRFVPPEG